MEMKYEMLKDDTIEVECRKLYRIRALRDFGDIKKGTIGGYIEKEDNLSHDGDCWIGDNAKVYNNAIVEDNTMVKRCAIVKHDATVSGDAIIDDYAYICNSSSVSGTAHVRNNAVINNYATIFGNSVIAGSAIISNYAKICGNAYILDDATISGRANIQGDVVIEDNAHIGGDVEITGATRIGKDGDITCSDDFITIGPIGRRSYITFYKSTVDKIYVIDSRYIYMTKISDSTYEISDFNSDINEYKKYIKSLHDVDFKHKREYMSIIKMAKRLLK